MACQLMILKDMNMEVHLVLNVIRVLLVAGVFVACKFAGVSPLVTVGLYSASLAVYSAFAVAAVFKALGSMDGNRRA